MKVKLTSVRMPNGELQALGRNSAVELMLGKFRPPIAKSPRMLRIESAERQVTDRGTLRLLSRAWWREWFRIREECDELRS